MHVCDLNELLMPQRDFKAKTKKKKKKEKNVLKVNTKKKHENPVRM